MMKILLYGGTFDPPHLGHINNLQAAAAAVRPDKIIVMPAGNPPHKAAAATPGALRVKMCACFKNVQVVKKCTVEVSDWEINREGRSYTVNTLEMLHGKYPAARLYLCMGSDMLTSFTGWCRWRDILRLSALVVESRQPGDETALYAAAQRLHDEGGEVVFADAPAIICSSTAIRGGIAAAGEIDADLLRLLPPPVDEIIRQNHLYGCKN